MKRDCFHSTTTQLGYTTCRNVLVCRQNLYRHSPLNLFATMAAAAFKKLVPMFDRVLVQRAEAITKTKGGIVIPEKAQAKVLQGTVIAVGPGSRNEKGDHVPLSIKVGDTVLLPEYGGTKVDLGESKEYHLFRETDILAKLES